MAFRSAGVAGSAFNRWTYPDSRGSSSTELLRTRSTNSSTVVGAGIGPPTVGTSGARPDGTGMRAGERQQGRGDRQKDWRPPGGAVGVWGQARPKLQL